MHKVVHGGALYDLESRGLLTYFANASRDPARDKLPIVGAYFRRQRVFTEQRILRTAIINALGALQDTGTALTVSTAALPVRGRYRGG